MLHAYADGRIFGETYGTGPIRVVWLHGWGRRGRDFAVAAQRLADDEGVASVALDLPGFGASPAPEVAGGARHYAALLAPVLREVSEGPVVLVGHSNGGRVATVLAASEPDRVSALVLSGAPLLRTTAPSSAPWRYRLVRRLHARGLVSEARMERARQRYGSRDYRAASGLMRDVLVISVNETFEDELARVGQPVHLVWGADDHDVPVAVAEAIRDAASRVSLRVLDGVGHLTPLEAPNALVHAVTEALEQ